jgi:hypothetical protein
MKRYLHGIMLFSVITLISACGPSGGGGETTPAPVTKATLKLITSGTGTTIYGIDVTVKLASGVTLKSTNPPYIDSNVVTLSDIASLATLTALYTAPTSSLQAEIRILIASANGFSTGEFCRVNGDIAAGRSPKDTDFSIDNFMASDANGSVISGLTPDVMTEIE